MVLTFCEHLACFSIITCWHNSKSVERRCSVFLKVQALAVCCRSSPVSVMRLFESMDVWRVLCCKASVFVVFLVVTLREAWCVSRCEYEASMSLYKRLACALGSFAHQALCLNVVVVRAEYIQ